MAKKKKSKKDNTDLYNRWKKEHNMTTSKDVKDNFKDMTVVRDNYKMSLDWLKTSCPWEKTKDGDGSWFDYRERQEKVWSMWYKPLDDDDFKSNVKSPMTTGRVESAMHKIKQINIGFTVLPVEEGDKLKAKVIQKVLNYFFRKSGMKYKLATWFKDALIYGTAFGRVYYTKLEKKVRLAKKDPSLMSAEDKKILKEYSGKKTIFGDPEVVVEYDDIVFEPIDYREVFPQPSARKIHGLEYASNWFIRRRVITLDQFKSEYKEDPNCFDVDKVKAVNNFDDEDLIKDLELPNDEEEEYVEILEMEDVENDKYRIVANDILIRSTPLPYNHKEITYIKIGAIEHTHRFFWRGLADQLMALQSEEEILKNMQYDMLHQKLRDSYIVNERDFIKFIEAYNQTGGRVLPVNIDGRPLDQVVKYIPQTPMDTGSFVVLEKIKQDATMATQFDPSQIGINTKDKTATQSMIDKEVVDQFIVATMESFSEGLIKLAEHIVELMIQFYSVPRVKKIVGEDNKEKLQKVFRKFRFEDEEVGIQDNDLIENTKKGELSFFELKSEYLNLEGDLDIQLSAESIKVKSKAFDAQVAQQAWDKLMPFAVIPNDPESFKKVPLPLFDGVKLAQWLVETNDIPEDVLLEPESNEEADIVRALQQNIKLNDGKNVQPIPGESMKHLMIHDQQLGFWQNKFNEIKEQMTINQEIGMMDQNIMKQAKDIEGIIEKFLYHMQGDQIPSQVGLRAMKPMETGVPQEQMPGMALGAIPQPQGMVPPQVDGNINLPNQMPPGMQGI